MTASLLLAALSLVYVAPMHVPSLRPQILIQNENCAVAQRDASTIAGVLGFSKAHITCGIRTVGTFEGRAQPYMPIVSNLITYSVDANSPMLPQSAAKLRLPGDVPFVAGTGYIVAYVKPDAVLLSFRPRNLRRATQALERAGISIGDIVSEQPDLESLHVKVRPPTAAQVLKIYRIVEQYAAYSVAESETRFVQNCNDTVTTLAGLALTEARRRANVIAQAAQGQLGNLLGVVDPGANVIDAVCGLGKDATVHQLHVASERGPYSLVRMPVYATVMRSLSVAWQLHLAANPPKSPLYDNEYADTAFSYRPLGAFAEDGPRIRGLAGVANGLAPNRISILLPDWGYDALAHSTYAGQLTYLGFGIFPLRPAIVMRVNGVNEFQPRIDALWNFLKSGTPNGQFSGLSFLYGRDDCRSSMDLALFHATVNAIAHTSGRPIRYLQETSALTAGEVACTEEPSAYAAWSDSSALKYGVQVASVDAGY